jgi:hypothetical protein
MKSSNSIVLVFLILTSCVTITKSTLTENNLKGNIRSIMAATYVAYDTSGEIHLGAQTANSIQFYNKEGNITQNLHTSFLSSGQTEWKNVTTYDNANRKVEEMQFDENGNLAMTYKTMYDNKGNLIEENNCGFTSEDPNLLNVRTRSFYDELGNTVKRETRLCKGKIIETTELKYDEHRNIIESIDFDAYMTSTKTTYRYDSKHFLIEEWKGSESTTYKYKLGKRGNWTTRYTYKNGIIGIVEKRDIEYY